MMGDTIDRAAHLYEGNMSIIKNTFGATLTKKSNIVCYHAVRESVVMGETLAAHTPGTENLADIMTKVL